MWPDDRLLKLFGVELPIIQAPMAGANGATMAIAVSEAGGLGSLPCAMLNKDGVRADLEAARHGTRKPINLNFFCHAPAAHDADRFRRWDERLARYYVEFGIEPPKAAAGPTRAPFDVAMCELVQTYRPEVVSFHFGLPDPDLMERVQRAGCKVIASATTVAEARWLETRGCDAVIAQGYEAGGHRGIFLAEDISTQPGTLALVPQVVDAVRIPVIAAGGIGDGRGIAAAFALGASGVQIGTAYLLTPESIISPLHRAALKASVDDATALTNVFTGRPARSVVNRLMREVGPISEATPGFPLAALALAPLRAKAEADGSTDFSSLWSGQSARFCRETGAGALTRLLAEEALACLRGLVDTN